MLSRAIKRNTVSALLDINSIVAAVVIFANLIAKTSDFAIQKADALMLLATIIPLALLSNMALGLYEPKMRDSIRGVFRRTILSAGLTFVMTAIVQGVAGALQLDSFGWSLVPAASILLTSALCYTLWRYLAFEKGALDFGKQRVLVIGSGDRAAFIPRRMRRQKDRRNFHILGFVPLAKGVDPDVEGRETVFQPLDTPGVSLRELVEQQQPDLILLANERKEHLPTQDLLACKMSGIQVCELEDFVEHELTQIAVEHLREEWLLTAPGFNLGRPWFDAMHYGLNAALALLMLIVVSPLMLLTALAIYLDDGRRDRATILYRQERTGLNGKPFYVLKFRSMGKDAEKNGAQWATTNDMRVTRIGGFLRKYRLDELPQLLNILRGDMCFVGPRPERPIFVNQLAETIPFFHYRHSVKPGLTGWAQVQYSYGASENDSREKLKFDLYYIKHRSVLLDLYVLIRTVEVVLYGKGR